MKQTKKQIEERVYQIEIAFREIQEYQLNLKYQYPKKFKEYKKSLVDLTKGK